MNTNTDPLTESMLGHVDAIAEAMRNIKAIQGDNGAACDAFFRSGGDLLESDFATQDGHEALVKFVDVDRSYNPVQFDCHVYANGKFLRFQNNDQLEAMLTPESMAILATHADNVAHREEMTGVV